MPCACQFYTHPPTPHVGLISLDPGDHLGRRLNDHPGWRHKDLMQLEKRCEGDPRDQINRRAQKSRSRTDVQDPESTRPRWPRFGHVAACSSCGEAAARNGLPCACQFYAHPSTRRKPLVAILLRVCPSKVPLKRKTKGHFTPCSKPLMLILLRFPPSQVFPLVLSSPAPTHWGRGRFVARSVCHPGL